MAFLIMSFLSENPAHGPEIFGALCDVLMCFIIVYLIVSFIKGRK